MGRYLVCCAKIITFALLRARVRREYAHILTIMKRNHTIGFDAECANRNNTGKGNYGRYIIDAVASSCRSNTYLRLYIPSHRDNSAYDSLAERSNIESMEPDGGLWRKLWWLWQIFGVSRDATNGGVELFHGLNNHLPYGLSRRNIRSVVTIHDVHLLNETTPFQPISMHIKRMRIKSSCRRADRIIAVSEGIKRDLTESLGIDPDKIDIIYTGCAQRFTQQTDEETVMATREKYSLPERYILNVGTQSRRRNIELIIEAMHKLPYPIDLVAVGQSTPHTNRLREKAAKLGIAERVHFISCDNNDDLAAIYQGAEMLVNPTKNSSFGMPLVEALSVGIPVIGTANSCHVEAAGPDIIYVSPDDSGELADKIDAILNSEELRQQIVTSGRNHISRFRPEVTAYNVLNCYKRIGIDLTVGF